MKLFFLVLINLIIFIAIPASAAWYYRTPSSAKPKSKTSAGVGNALQELDRLLARPSIEYRQEIEHTTQPCDDDQAGE
jgi:hypothetical protein